MLAISLDYKYSQFHPKYSRSIRLASSHSIHWSKYRHGHNPRREWQRKIHKLIVSTSEIGDATIALTLVNHNVNLILFATWRKPHKSMGNEEKFKESLRANKICCLLIYLCVRSVAQKHSTYAQGPNCLTFSWIFCEFKRSWTSPPNLSKEFYWSVCGMAQAFDIGSLLHSIHSTGWTTSQMSRAPVFV